MIYLYKSISPHCIDSFHNYLDYFYKQLFTKKYKKYDVAALFEKDFQTIIEANYRKLSDYLAEVFTIYTNELTIEEQQQFELVYLSNNDIEAICNGRIAPLEYAALPDKMKDVINTLYSSEGILWIMVSEQSPAKEIKAKCKTLKNHYDDFREINKYPNCPFCGLDTLLTGKDDYKDDYDHLLPKSMFPFVSINFQNLFPTCGNCNRKYKLNGNPVYTKDIPPKRKVLFFPYEKIDGHFVTFEIDATKYNLEDTSAWELKISCTPSGNESKKESWVNNYKIDTRYKVEISRYSYSWCNDLVVEYNEKKGKHAVFDFELFKSKTLKKYDKALFKRGILPEKTYHEFVLNHPKAEDILNSTMSFDV